MSYWENTKDSTHRKKRKRKEEKIVIKLGLVNMLIKVEWYKIHIEQSVMFLYLFNEQLHKKVKKIILFMTVSKKYF